MSIELFRIDDRLIHGQVVVGWGQPLGLGFIVLVDDEVASSEWEQELYRMGVPPHMDVVFASVDEAVARLADWEADPRPAIVLMGEIDTAAALCEHPPTGLVEHLLHQAQIDNGPPDDIAIICAKLNPPGRPPPPA